jgi:hypothetical protein
LYKYFCSKKERKENEEEEEVMNICEPPRLTMGGKILLRLDPLEYNRWDRVIYPFPSSLKMPQKTFLTF